MRVAIRIFHRRDNYVMNDYTQKVKVFESMLDALSYARLSFGPFKDKRIKPLDFMPTKVDEKGKPHDD